MAKAALNVSVNHQGPDSIVSLVKRILHSCATVLKRSVFLVFAKLHDGPDDDADMCSRFHKGPHIGDEKPPTRSLVTTAKM